MDDCIFCKIVKKQAPAQFVYEDSDYCAFLDKFPQTRGHLQLIPKTHYPWVWEIPNMGAFFVVAQKIIRAIIPVLGADHVTLTTRGDEVHHAHLWIVPQYTKDVQIREGAQSVANLLRRALLHLPAGRQD